jgi:hypothetical protein
MTWSAMIGEFLDALALDRHRQTKLLQRRGLVS